MRAFVYAVVVLGALNIAFLIGNASLSSALERTGRMRVDEALAALREAEKKFTAELTRLSGERARLAERVESLTGIDDAQSFGYGSSPTEESSNALVQSRVEVPDTREIPRMTPQELDAIASYRRTMPDVMNESALFEGVDAVLADPSWNPEALRLGQDDRAELERLLQEYRYYARLSIRERRAAIQKDLDHRRDIGAFVEYPEDQPPSPGGPLGMSHSEPSNRPGYRRMYFFYGDDYPDIYHQAMIEKEQSLGVFVDVYALIQSQGIRGDP